MSKLTIISKPIKATASFEEGMTFTSLPGCKSPPQSSQKLRRSRGLRIIRRSGVPLSWSGKTWKDHKQIPGSETPALGLDQYPTKTALTLGDVIANVQMNPKGLRLRYPSEYVSWRAMKDRRKQGFIVAPEFETFAGFLCVMGQKPSPKHTLDRADTLDPEYSPSKARWLDKTGQTRNRRGTVSFKFPGGDCVFYAPEVAKMTGLRENTIRKRKREGWTDAEIFMGRRVTPNAIDCTPPSDKPPSLKAKVGDIVQGFMGAVKASNPGFVAETPHPKHFKQIERLLRDPAREFTLGPALQHVAGDRWLDFIDRAKAEAGAFGCPSRPTLDFALRHENLAITMYQEDATKVFKPNAFGSPKLAPPKPVTVAEPALLAASKPNGKMSKEEWLAEFE